MVRKNRIHSNPVGKIRKASRWRTLPKRANTSLNWKIGGRRHLNYEEEWKSINCPGAKGQSWLRQSLAVKGFNGLELMKTNENTRKGQRFRKTKGNRKRNQQLKSKGWF